MFEDIRNQKEILWENPYLIPFSKTDAIHSLVVSDEDIEDAEKRLVRFSAFIKKVFPEMECSDGIIESPLTEIKSMQAALEQNFNTKIPGNLYLKQDSHLAIVGSIKARGGIYEVLKFAEDLALKNGLITEDESYEKFSSDEMKAFFKDYLIQVGSTGNLGMSVGIMSAALGFQVKIHMSHDAKQWKKDLLRSRGVEVLEYEDDYSFAVAEGRKNSENNPKSYFVDDEKSINLFLGYAVAAKRLKAQLTEKGITIDENHPLIVYLPAGVGGAPGGICYGLKRIFKDNVHCFFIEPTLFPSVLLGIATQKHEKINVRDFGLGEKTEADGLACASPSGFVTRIVSNQVSGVFTVKDAALYQYLKLLYKTEEIKIEPSACAAFEGPTKLLCYKNAKKYLKEHSLTKSLLKNTTQIAWATGGALVPEEVFREYLEK